MEGHLATKERDDDWLITDEGGGVFDLRHLRRPVGRDFRSLDEAMEYAKRRGAEVVTVVEEDGYRVTHRL